MLTFDPWTFHGVSVRIVEPNENPTRVDFMPYRLSLPSHWVAVWLTYSEIPSSKLIAEHLYASWLMGGGFLTYGQSDIS